MVVVAVVAAAAAVVVVAVAVVGNEVDQDDKLILSQLTKNRTDRRTSG